jgi:peptide/nickel transport system substrate-binding protein
MKSHKQAVQTIRDGRRRVLKAIGAGTAISLSGITVSQALAAEADAPKRGGKIRVATQTQGLGDSLDPAKAQHTADYTRAFMFFSGLTELDADFQTRNGLAEAIESDDKIKWTVRLKSGVQFHDGKTLTADDVAFSLLRHKDPANASKVKLIADTIVDIKTISADKLEITLKEAYVDFPTLLAIPQFVIVKAGTRDFSRAVGTGPYVCKEFIPAQRTIGTRNSSFWKPGRPYLDEVELIGITDDAARTNALLSGDVHLISPVPMRDVERLKQTPGMQALESPSQFYADLAMRQDMDPTSNPDLARGVQCLYDRQRVVKVLLRGHGTLANDHPVPEWHPYFMKGLPQRVLDLDKAKYHFRKMGSLKGTPEIIVMSQVETGVDASLMVQQAAKSAGLDIGVRRVPADGYWSTYWLKYPMLYSNVLPRPTLDLLYSQFFQSNAVWNESGWKNTQFDELLTQARRESNDVKRKQMYGDMQTLIYEKNSLAIPAFINFIDGQSTKLKGLKGSPSGRLMGYRFAEFAWLA